MGLLDRKLRLLASSIVNKIQPALGEVCKPNSAVAKDWHSQGDHLTYHAQEALHFTSLAIRSFMESDQNALRENKWDLR
jgi:hypothetical protein